MLSHLILSYLPFLSVGWSEVACSIFLNPPSNLYILILSKGFTMGISHWCVEPIALNTSFAISTPLKLTIFCPCPIIRSYKFTQSRLLCFRLKLPSHVSVTPTLLNVTPSCTIFWGTMHFSSCVFHLNLNPVWTMISEEFIDSK